MPEASTSSRSPNVEIVIPSRTGSSPTLLPLAHMRNSTPAAPLITPRPLGSSGGKPSSARSSSPNLPDLPGVRVCNR
ncbi:hypothetical protein FIBSPDRAFT_862727 [Athelia psychrophila]|uniref:Uncharacterized protein n=1 Tax=Athelia psychrophila TaxID=1759441 RepID=A0A166HXE5_9AGAM|nr:hypothetical protein FIBSPDRAFT_862727 [Fibularhizoctonia sp. CBS 109695]